jgi:putative spermidine/putrescine transport system ATP-binding protein
MDEPLGALDKQLREHMQYELKALHEKLGVTFVYVTHDQGEALTMSDRVAVFNEGVIQQLDTVDRLYETPSNRFVAGFVGDSTVLKGQLDRGGEHAEMKLPDGRVLRGLNVGGAAAGAAVEACIRPERVVLHRRPETQGTNMLAAEVARVIYYGDHLRLLCSVGGGQTEATVKLPLDGLDGAAAPRAGEAVVLEFPTAHARIYAP